MPLCTSIGLKTICRFLMCYFIYVCITSFLFIIDCVSRTHAFCDTLNTMHHFHTPQTGYVSLYYSNQFRLEKHMAIAWRVLFIIVVNVKISTIFVCCAFLKYSNHIATSDNLVEEDPRQNKIKHFKDFIGTFV